MREAVGVALVVTEPGPRVATAVADTRDANGVPVTLTLRLADTVRVDASDAVALSEPEPDVDREMRGDALTDGVLDELVDALPDFDADEVAKRSVRVGVTRVVNEIVRAALVLPLADRVETNETVLRDDDEGERGAVPVADTVA